MHYVIIIIIIIVIVVYQIKIFNATNTKLDEFDSIFSDNKEDYKLLSEKRIEETKNASDEHLNKMLAEAGIDNQKYYVNRYTADNGDTLFFKREAAQKELIRKYRNQIGIFCDSKNPIYNEIQTSINSYLSVNKSGVSDFHLMKDIVDRNCDALDDEISTQIPIPLYLGLVGTMAGILVGIGYLWLNGGLDALLSIPKQGKLTDGEFEILTDGLNQKAINGVNSLLGGIALAMISSILGILLTTFSSLSVKNVKSGFEKNKHLFLSWIQGKLLPSLSNDVAQTLEKMSQNLVSFNNEFSTNTSNLGNALSKVNESYKLQTELINAVNKINEGRLTATNLQLLNRLIECSGEIGNLGTYLQNVNSYLQNVRDLNTKLDNYENRTQFIENASKFYAKHENWLTEHIEEANRAMKDAVIQYNGTMSESMVKIQESLETQIHDFGKVIQAQYEKLGEKSKEVDNIVTELHNLTAIKDSIAKFEHATSEQNRKISELANNIKELAQAKTVGGEVKVVQHIPRKTKILAIAGICIVSLSGLFYILPIIVKWLSKLINWIF